MFGERRARTLKVKRYGLLEPSLEEAPFMMTSARKIANSFLFVVGTLSLVASVRAQPPVALPIEPPSIAVGAVQLPGKAVQDKVLLLLRTIEGDRYEEFAAAITEDFKAAMPPKAFQEMREPLWPRLGKGYDLSYLAEVRKGDYTTYVWKIVFRDEKFDMKNINEVMMTVTLKDAPEAEQSREKVAGLLLD